MLTRVKMGFIGGGNMAEAIIKGVLEKGLVSPDDVVASDVLPERGQTLHERYGIAATTDNRAAAQDADILILAIKPQVLPLVLPDLSGVLRDGQLALSIIAGATIRALSAGLGHEEIVRAMPNTPAQIGAGMSVWIATPAVSEEQKAQVQAILQALGQEIEVHEERYVDMATAINGSGPAYVFLILEALVDVAVHMGFSQPLARKLVIQTVLGSALFAQGSSLHLAELRNMVTSPGGTTAEALLEMERGGLRATLANAVLAAYEKSKRLGKGE